MKPIHRKQMAKRISCGPTVRPHATYCNNKATTASFLLHVCRVQSNNPIYNQSNAIINATLKYAFEKKRAFITVSLRKKTIFGIRFWLIWKIIL
jgi:hypothetical protein